jgi:hypothetical protein
MTLKLTDRLTVMTKQKMIMNQASRATKRTTKVKSNETCTDLLHAKFTEALSRYYHTIIPKTFHCNSKKMKKSALTIPFIQKILDLDPGDKIKISKEKRLTSLWAGYGEVNSLTVSVNVGASKKDAKSFPLIIKRVDPPTNSNSVGNLRKIKSYHIEAYFYKHIAPILLQLNESGVLSCPIATPYSVQKGEIDGSGDDSGNRQSFTFVLSDLTDEFSGYSSYPGLDIDQTKQAISWLAAFHASFYNHDVVFNPETEPDSDSEATVWSEGGYWHLKTRLDELEQISSSQGMFRNAAYAIDERMNRNHAGSLTLVHGDFKEANILFGNSASSSNSNSSCGCAVVDFQYCGRGYGTKDLVMLIVSSVSSRVLQEVGEEGLVHLYAEKLRQNLQAIGKLSQEDLEQKSNPAVLQMQYELALVDYMRFMAGWGTWGTNCGYAEERSVEILKNIASSWSKGDARSKSLLSMREHDWRDAIDEKYPEGLF